jgi:hypothetical protein
MALAFNLLGEDSRKGEPKASENWKGRSCDLQSVGYRVLRKASSQGAPVEVLQFAFKMYTPVTTWHRCQVSLLIDVNGDGEPDQELAGVDASAVSGIAPAPFFTVLLDAPAARAIRLDYEKHLGQTQPAEEAPKLDYTPAVQALGAIAPFEQSTLTVIEVPLAAVGRGADGQIHVKAASLGEGGDVVEPDDFLGSNPLGDWLSVPATSAAQPYYGMDEITGVKAATGANLALQKGSGQGKLIMYYPMNQLGQPGQDGQSQVIDPAALLSRLAGH